MADKQKRHSGLDIVMSGGQRLDPAIKQVLKTAVENKAALTAKQRRDRKRQRASYDITSSIQGAIQYLAKKEDTSASQIVEMLLSFGLQAYVNGDVGLLSALMDSKSPAHTLRFSWNLSIPDEWMKIVENMQKQPKKPNGWGI